MGTNQHFMFPNGNNNTSPETMHLAYIAAPAREDRAQTKRISADIIPIEHQVQRSLANPSMVDSNRQLVECSPEAIFVCRENELTLLNPAACRLLGAEGPNELLNRNLLDFVDPAFHALFHERARLTASATPSTPFTEQVWIRLDGSRFHAEIAATNLLYNDSPAVQIVVRDMSERKRNEAIQLGQNRILNMVATGASLPDTLAEIAAFIEAQSDQHLYSIHICDADGVTLGGNAGAGMRDDWPIRGKDGKTVGTLTLYLGQPVAPSPEDLKLLNICTHLAGIAIESRASEERIRFLAHYDGLTGLPNRFLFQEYLDQALNNARHQAGKFAVFFLDFDKFKEINDSLGHAAGDRVLREIALRLRAALKDTDKIARMGGDEFYVLIEDLRDERHAANIAQKLLEAAGRPVSIDQQEHRLSISIGIAIYPEDGMDGTALLQNADSAMYRAKELGKNRYRYYASDR
jgi:diguanylate cyclase (GGDEF)-like protein/PAS domain S-box-containing protein